MSATVIVECLWVKIRRVVSKENLTVGIYYQPPNQDNTNEVIFESFKQASGQQNRFLWVISTTQTFVTQQLLCHPSSSWEELARHARVRCASQE